MRSNYKNSAIRQPWYLRGVLAVLVGATLIACDNVPTETSPTGGNPSLVLGYTGPSCSTTDACTFKVEFWDKMSTYQCKNCHDSQSSSAQSPFFMESSNVNAARIQALTIVNLPALRPATLDPTALQEIVKKINDGHNCGDTTACAFRAENVLKFITNWAIGGAATSGAEGNNTIILTAPTIRDVGTSRSFPDTGTTVSPINNSSFANTIWPLLKDNCSECHQESSATPQAPFFAEDDNDDTTTGDIEASYAAVVSSQKINLDDPAVSRLVVRLNPEFHNCWATPTGTDPTGCITSGQLMLDAITTFAGGIPLTTISSDNPDWKVSKALDLTDGIIASGGNRDDTSTIALYEMKAGSGSVLYDTSGVEPALNLNLFDDNAGDSDPGFAWVGGWGIEFTTGGRAQGSAQNSKIRDQIISSGEYSIEAWIVPANVSQGSVNEPARIISYTGGPATRNFSLGQAEYRYAFRNRSENSGADGEEELITDDMDEDLQASQQHVVVTYKPVEGRKIYVNGVDVSLDDNAGAGSIDPVDAGSLLSWDDSFAFVLGHETGGNNVDYQWKGKLRLVAIHDRAMTQFQITKNFDAGVGEKFYLMFSVSHFMDDDTNCYLDPGNQLGDQCFIYMLVSQFDSYSYLFNAPTFINLNTGTSTLSGISGMRIGLNGKEPAVGQGFSNIGKPTLIDINAAANTSQELSSIGTIIALEKGAGADEFFLSFEEFGTFSDNNSHADAEYVCNFIANDCLTTTPVSGTPVSDIGLRTFDDINATMAGITGVDRNTTEVKDTFDLIKQQLPPVENIDGFVSANQMAIAQLAIQYCDALVESTGLNIGLRDDFFNGFVGFNSPIATAFASSTEKDQIVDVLYNKMVGYPDPNSTPIAGVTLTNIPSIDDVKAELIGPVGTNPNNLFDKLGTVMTNVCNDPDPLINVNCDNSDIRTRAVTKALCTSVLGSAIMLIQ